ncbi:MAG: MinD/ParA family protein [Deltaproteobacteria bacterium]|nr:MinD/ParA family protein [Deltaproteobacteria bacterium]
MDQAEGLRSLLREDADGRGLPDLIKGPGWTGPKVISVTSGKGGVGKTNVVANLGLAFTELGKKVLILDADLGLANIDVLLGLSSRYTIEHLLKREKSLADILIPGPGGMSIMPAGSGVLDLVDLNESQKLFLLNEFDQYADHVDILLIDTGAGIASNVLYFNMAAQESIIIVTPEPTSITDAYALIKVLSIRHRKKSFMILVNQAVHAQEAKEVFAKINRVVDRFLGTLSLDYLGYVPFDENMTKAVRSQKAILELYPESSASKSFRELARLIVEKPIQNRGNGNVQFFWKQLLQGPAGRGKGESGEIKNAQL